MLLGSLCVPFDLVSQRTQINYKIAAASNETNTKGRQTPLQGRGYTYLPKINITHLQ